jgi:hypothetical protein
MASKDLWFDLGTVRPHQSDDAALDRIVNAQLSADLAGRAVEVREAVKHLLGTPITGGANGVIVSIPLPTATGQVLASWGSKPHV